MKNDLFKDLNVWDAMLQRASWLGRWFLIKYCNITCHSRTSVASWRYMAYRGWWKARNGASVLNCWDLKSVELFLDQLASCRFCRNLPILRERLLQCHPLMERRSASQTMKNTRSCDRKATNSRGLFAAIILVRASCFESIYCLS